VFSITDKIRDKWIACINYQNTMSFIKQVKSNKYWQNEN
jgi:hypothetical protein